MGRKSIWILTLHFLAFKVTEVLEIWWYNLPNQMIGCHTVIPQMDNWFWCLHTTAGILIPLLFAYSYSRIKNIFVSCTL